MVARGGDPALLDAVADALAAIRRTKTAEKRSLKAPVARLEIVDTAGRLAAVRAAEGDLRQAGNVATIELREGTPPSVVVELAPDDG